MSNRITRTLFWFQDGDERFQEMTTNSFGLATLLNRLINEKYIGKKIKLINIYFNTKEVYQKFPALIPNHVHYFSNLGGYLAYYGEFDIQNFILLSEEAKNQFFALVGTNIKASYHAAA
jgi:hypothetical protein